MEFALVAVHNDIKNSVEEGRVTAFVLIDLYVALILQDWFLSSALNKFSLVLVCI